MGLKFIKGQQAEKAGAVEVGAGIVLTQNDDGLPRLDVESSAVYVESETAPAQLTGRLRLLGASITDVSGTAEIHFDSRYYTKTALQTSGQAVVDWGNLANLPAYATRWPGFSEVTGSIADSQLSTNVPLLNKTNIFKAAQDMGGTNKIINLADPTLPQDAATRAYVHTVASTKTTYSDLWDQMIVKDVVMLLKKADGTTAFTAWSHTQTPSGADAEAYTKLDITGGYAYVDGQRCVVNSLFIDLDIDAVSEGDYVLKFDVPYTEGDTKLVNLVYSAVGPYASADKEVAVAFFTVGSNATTGTQFFTSLKWGPDLAGVTFTNTSGQPVTLHDPYSAKLFATINSDKKTRAVAYRANAKAFYPAITGMDLGSTSGDGKVWDRLYVNEVVLSGVKKLTNVNSLAFANGTSMSSAPYTKVESDARFVPGTTNTTDWNAPAAAGLARLITGAGPEGTTTHMGISITHDSQATYVTQFSGRAGAFYVRSMEAGTWQNWYKLYHTGFKPTAADVGALPLSGGTLTGTVRVQGYLRGVNTTNNAIASMDARASDTSSVWHKYIRNDADTAYDPYWENWYDGNSYHKIGVENDTFVLGGSLSFTGTLTGGTVPRARIPEWNAGHDRIGPPTGYGAIQVTGGSGNGTGWTGIQFSAYNRTLLINANTQGFYDEPNAQWAWGFTGGELAFGVVPASRVSAGAFGSGNFSFSGNLGFGTTDIEGWNTNFRAIQLGGMASLMFPTATGEGNGNHLTRNGYYDGAWKYRSTNPAADYYQNNGTHVFRVAPSGTIDTTLTWTTALTINTVGNFGIGTTDIEATGSGHAAIQLGDRGHILYGLGSTGVLHLSQNAYWDGAWRYRALGAAAQAVVQNGGFEVRVAPSGSIGTAVPWYVAFRVTEDGYVHAPAGRYYGNGAFVRLDDGGAHFFTSGSAALSGRFKSLILSDSYGTADEGYRLLVNGPALTKGSLSSATEIYAGNWLRTANNGGRTGLYWQAGPGAGWHIYHRNYTYGTPAKYPDLMIRSGSTINSSIAFTINDEIPRGYIHWTKNADRIGFLTNGRAWAFYIDSAAKSWAAGDFEVAGNARFNAKAFNSQGHNMSATVWNTRAPTSTDTAYEDGTLWIVY